MNDAESHAQAMSLPMREVVRQLIELLGATTVAQIGNVGETRAVAQWMANREPQRPHVLRFTLQLALMLSSAVDRATIRAWFHGADPGLGDRIPAVMLHTQELNEIQGEMLAAARTFMGRPSHLVTRKELG